MNNIMRNITVGIMGNPENDPVGVLNLNENQKFQFKTSLSYLSISGLYMVLCTWKGMPFMQRPLHPFSE
jgi:hypothetical protein